MTETKLQILLATYNSEAWLEPQLDSILVQDFTDFTLLIRDGGSSDNTLEIIDDWRRRYPEQIRFIGGSKASASENFFFLLAASTAPLVMLCDHDDVWKPDKIELELKKYQETQQFMQKFLEIVTQ